MFSKCSGDSRKRWKASNEFMPSKASPSPNSIIVNDEVCNSNHHNKHFSSVASKLINFSRVVSKLIDSSDQCNDDNVQPRISSSD